MGGCRDLFSQYIEKKNDVISAKLSLFVCGGETGVGNRNLLVRGVSHCDHVNGNRGEGGEIGGRGSSIYAVVIHNP